MRVLRAVAAALVVLAATAAVIRADHPGRTLAVTMTNDPAANEIKVYDADTHALLQTLSTNGKGGAGGNARGIAQYGRELVAVVNNGSSNVAIFKRDGDQLKFVNTVSTTSAPVSVDFGNDHMYVAGATTVDSFALQGRTVTWLDGTGGLELVGGGAPPVGSTAQVGVINGKALLVTLKTPDPGTVDVVSLRDGRVTDLAPTAVAAPTGTLTPFGFSVYSDGTALITLAGSNQNGLFRDGAFTAITAPGPGAPCWATTVGKYAFIANTGSRTISRLIGTGSHIFVDDETAAVITAGGGPADIDADAGVLGVIDRGGDQSHLSLFTYNDFGELIPHGTPINVGVPNANGIAVLSADGRERD